MATQLEVVGNAELDICAELDRYASGRDAERDLERVTLFCHRVAISHLRFLDRRSCIGVGVKRERYFKSLNDEAFSCIAHLFCSLRFGGRAPIAGAWSSFREQEGANDEACLHHLKNLVKAVVRQQRVDTLRRLRPQEWKIRRNLRGTITRCRQLRLIRRREELFVVPRDTNGPLFPVPEEVVREHCFAVFEGTDSLQKMVGKAMEALRPPGPRRNCLLLGDLSRVVVDYLVGMLSGQGAKRAWMAGIGEDVMLDLLGRPVIERTRRRIRRLYVEKVKLEEGDGKAYVRALSVYLHDLLKCGSTGTHFSYLEEEFPGLTPEKFAGSHKSRFGYLVSELKRDLTRSAGDFSRVS